MFKTYGNPSFAAMDKLKTPPTKSTKAAAISADPASKSSATNNTPPAVLHIPPKPQAAQAASMESKTTAQPNTTVVAPGQKGSACCKIF